MAWINERSERSVCRDALRLTHKIRKTRLVVAAFRDSSRADDEDELTYRLALIVLMQSNRLVLEDHHQVFPALSASETGLAHGSPREAPEPNGAAERVYQTVVG
jgi:hypothetical protein